MKVRVTDFDEVKAVIQILKEFASDERVPADVREEYMDKMNEMLEGK